MRRRDDAFAPVLMRLSHLKHEQHHLDKQALALNLSFVLHERSDSAAVRSAVSAVGSHANFIARLNRSKYMPIIAGEPDHADVQLWLTASIGLPQRLASELHVSDDHVLNVDADSATTQAIRFFQAPATLSLPEDESRRIGIAALILRPERRSSQLVVTGVHDWPVERDAGIRSLERLIQAYAGQWMPPRALWTAPAETLLPGEVYG